MQCIICNNKNNQNKFKIRFQCHMIKATASHFKFPGSYPRDLEAPALRSRHIALWQRSDSTDEAVVYILHR